MKAATGEEVSAEDLGGADIHTRRSGVADHFAEDDDHAIEICRVDRLHIAASAHRESGIAGRPGCSAAGGAFLCAAEIYGILPALVPRELRCTRVYRTPGRRQRIPEFKARYGATLVCGFARIHGYPVGILGNNGVLFSESALKGTHFIELCDQRGIRCCSFRTLPVSWWA